MRPYSAWMSRAPSKRSTGWIPFCPCRPAERKDMVSSTTGMDALAVCGPGCEAGKVVERQRPGNQCRVYRTSLPRLSQQSNGLAKFISSWTICPRTRPKPWEEFLQANPKVRSHFTPTYSSWLNQVEIWFSKIERDVHRPRVFTSVADRARKLRKYIRAYGKSAKPVRWTSTDTSRRVRPPVTI